MPKGSITKAEAKQLDDGKWEVRHEDGTTEVLSDAQFNRQYTEDAGTEEPNQPVGQPEPVVEDDDRSEVVNTPKAVRPETYDGERFEDTGDTVKQYLEEVEAELDNYEEGIKNVRRELSAVKKAKGEPDFGPLRHAVHELAHGNPLSRTAHPVTTRRDGPERLRPAPTAEESISSGPHEETNPEAARRIFGR